MIDWPDTIAGAAIGALLGSAGGWFAGRRVARHQVYLERQYETIEHLWDALKAAEEGFHEHHGGPSSVLQRRASRLLVVWGHMTKAGLLARRLDDRYADLRDLCSPLASIRPTKEQQLLMYAFRDHSRHASDATWAECMPPDEARTSIVRGIDLAERYFSEP